MVSERFSGTETAAPAAPRPPVSVVMPFAGSAADARQALSQLARVARRPGDELILVDNTPAGVAATAGHAMHGVSVVPAVREGSSYHARNVGAQAATNDWILFLDADCRPDPGLIDAYFDPLPELREGVLAGVVLGDPGQSSPTARYSRSRGYLDQRALLDDPFRPHAVTANMLVRRSTLRSVGGFAEGVRSGGDSDFSWRVQEAGWRISARPRAQVHHDHRESLRSFLRVALRYAAGRAWLRRRWPGAFASRPGATQAVRASLSSLLWLTRGRPERAAFRAIDAAVGLADLLGEQLPNRPPARGPAASEATDVTVLTDRFPAISETFVVGELLALQRAGHRVRVEAAHRPVRQAPGALGLVPVRYAEDDSRLEKLLALGWLVTRHPLGVLRDRHAAARWAQAEAVLPLQALAPIARRLSREPDARLHCHFAGPAALTTLRISRLLGRSYAVTAHAYEIFREPRNLREKLESAALVFTGCSYNVERLRELAPAARLHEVVMGVDPRQFRRTVPLRNGRRVVAVGRLVEKKGFADAIEAVARLRASDVEELLLVGDGPLREELESLASRLGVSGRVRFHGAAAPEDVRGLLEDADVLAMPCVVAADGDRDSMPVVVKEAMALELLVVATAEVGLPELVGEPWGRLVAPHDADALARALTELLALDPAARAAAGRAGREFVLQHADVDRETAKLASLLGLRSPASGSAARPAAPR